MNERLSALMDDALDEGAVDSLMDAMRRDPQAERTWQLYGLIGDSLRGEVARLGNSGLAEEVERAVDRGQPQMGIFLGKLMVHGFRRDVLLSKERRQDQFSLASQFQLMLGQMLAKHIHFFESFAHGVSFGVKEAH